MQSFLIQVLRGSPFFERMGWCSYQSADAVVALTPWEAQLMREVFAAPTDRLWIVPNGVEPIFLNCPPAPKRGPWLVCTATITARKRVVELALAAVRAATPLWVIGGPYSASDPYFVQFRDLADTHSDLLRYEGGISDRAKLATIYAEARGFALLSTMESLSLSALEAAACDCPLLLSDLPWARTSFAENATYVPIADPQTTASSLRKFYDTAPALPRAVRPAGWAAIAAQFKELYMRLLSTSR